MSALIDSSAPVLEGTSLSEPRVAAAGNGDPDPLLESLRAIAKWHGADFSEDAVLAGLPLKDGKLTPTLLLQAAHRAGFRARLVDRTMRNLPQSVLPAILILKGDRAGILKPAGDGRDVHFSLAGESGDADIDLKREYSGFAVFLQPVASDVEERRPDARWWFWQTMWRFRGYYLRLVPSAFLVSTLGLAMPLFTMLVYDRVVPNDAVETLWVLAVGIGAVFGFEYLLRLLRGVTMERAGREMDMVLASDLYEQILALEMQARPSSASMLAARTKAYEVLRDFFMSATMLAIVDLPFSLLMMAALFFIGGPMGWVVVGSASAALLVGVLFQIPLRKSVITSSESGIERQAMLSETVNGLESVKGANAEGALQYRFESMISGASEKDVRMHWLALLGTSTTAVLINLTTVAIVVMGVFRVKSGDLTMGGMIACVMIASRTMTPIAAVSGLMTRFQQALQSLRSLREIMALPRESGGHLKFVQRSVFDFNFVFDDVTVRYPGQHVPALKNISIKILQGQRVALLGRMGSGKSTLLRLLAKLYGPTEGKVLLDGVDLAQYHPAVVRNDTGYLPQDATVFRGTIRDNVALGSRGVTDEQVLQALRLAGLESFVRKHPNGMHAPVGEQGSLLSGGQRRALVLARSLLKRPRLVLLDEPIANMDPQSEKEFVQALKRYLEQDPRHTLIVATHKTSMLALVDHLIVLNEGKIFAAGEKGAVLASLAAQNRQTASAPSHQDDSTTQVKNGQATAAVTI